jgi:uncharacterized protein (TIGR03545 family)
MDQKVKKPSLIRWERVGPVLGTAVLLAILIVIFLDPVLKWAIVKAGQSVFGARVNIASVKTKLLKGRITVNGLQVADKSSPMKNLFQWDQAAFDFQPGPLIEKKVVIEEASINGLKFGVPRKTSGALTFSEKQPGFVSKAVGRLSSQVETLSLKKFSETKEKYNPQTALDPKHFKTTAAAEKAKTQLTRAPGDIQKQIDQLNAQARAADLQQRVQALNQGDSSAAGVARKLSEAKKLETDLQTFRTDLSNTQRSVMGQIESAQNQVEAVKSAREEDWKAVKTKLALPTLDKDAMARAIFGPAMVKWSERLLDGVHLARQQMPPKPKSPPSPPRGRARIIEFPRLHDDPRFLLMKAQVAGEIGLDKPFGFTGTVTGITTNPPLYGKPATIELAGTQGGRSFMLKGLLDHTHDIPVEALEGVYNGFSLSAMQFGPPDGMALGMNQGTGRARMALKLRGDTLDGHAEIQGSDLAVQPKVDLKSDSPVAQRAQKNIMASLAAVKSMTVGVGLSGTLDSPRLDIDSNIGAIVSDALKSALGAEVAEQEKALRAQFDQLTAAKVQDLQGQVDQLKEKALPQLASQNKMIDDLMNQIKQKSASSLPGPAGKPLDSFKNIFGR